MKLQILQENFTKSLALATKFTSTKAQLPVLNNVLLNAQKNKLLISSTNLENSVSITNPAKVDEDGKITVPAKIISDIVANLPKGSLDLETEKEHLKITSGKFSSMVSGMNPSDFPEIKSVIDTKKAVTIPKEDLLDAVNKVGFSTSIDETRPVLTGILFIFSKGELTLVSTDGFRLSRKTISLKNVADGQKIILPKFVLSEITKLGEGDTVFFDFNKEDNQAYFSVDDTILSSRVIEGEFPDYEKIIPKSSSINVSVDKQELQRSIKLASVFARDSSNIVKIKVERDTLTVSAESQVYGNQSTQVDVRVETDEKLSEFVIAFNYHFLEEVLNLIDSEDLKLGFSTPNAPAIVADTKDENFLHLIMPLRIQS
ncbi:DNA polymerase III subunit beta [Candidatus Woesebacteria bacterium]|nr:DNA polymerase III subunit beta [Candidatus Woesebacteria bacterium]